MAAIITDQLRILNTKDFVASVASTTNSYYTWIGLPNATEVDSNWNITPPNPRDSFNEENKYWDSMIALKKVTSSDVQQVVPKNTWESGITYDMYRNDIRAENPSKPSNAISCPICRKRYKICRIKLYNITWFNCIQILPNISITTTSCCSWF